MTYHPNDLRAAVDALTVEVREPVTRVINGTTRTERVTHPPLLVQLEEAIHGSMRSGSGASSNLPGTAIPLGAFTRAGRPDGVVCLACRRIYVGRSNWRRRHPGEPMPDHLLIASERAS